MFCKNKQVSSKYHILITCKPSNKSDIKIQKYLDCR